MVGKATSRTTYCLIAVAAALGVICPTPRPALAARTKPKDVEPVRYEGVEYRAPHSKMGHVEAWDISTGKKLWETRVYSLWIKPWLEADVQWVFITELDVRDGKVWVTNERGKCYALDLKSGKVRRSSWKYVFLLAAGSLVFAAIAWTLRKRIRASKPMPPGGQE
ncbi:MAG: hypothetical protein JW889_05530 [Verrucomicrobia bacterium]|nr:hypothetical protein [Verrucomicrobiota bacterium]